MITALLGLLAAAQSPPPVRGLRVEELSAGHFRIIVTSRGANADPATLANAMFRAEMATRQEAARRCADRGGAVPVDRGQINLLADHWWEAIQTFACRTQPAPAPTPPAGS